MKEHIDTMPLWEAFREDCECPICRLRAANEAKYREYFMGASVMEPDVRVETNQKGFCARHYGQMFKMGNRLALALGTQTYLREVIARVEADAKAREDAPKKGGLFARKPAAPQGAGTLAETASTCVLCERLETAMERYMDTLAVLWKGEKEFRALFAGCKGFCVPHYAQILELADKRLSGAERAQFVSDAIQVQRNALARIDKELEWFTLKFDYRNADKPWGTSEDAVERTLNKLRMLSVPRKEDEPDAQTR